MKSMKRVLALALMVVMVLGCISVPAFAYTDVPSELDDAVNLLSHPALGIFVGYPDGSFQPDGSITRAEAATVICRLVGAGEIAKVKAETRFSDVPAEHWASGFVKTATDLNIIDGFPDGTYSPSSPVTYEQMVKLVVAALGYRAQAEANGGYPTGYLYTGTQRGVTEGITGTVGSDAYRGSVAQMLYNALDIPLAIRRDYGDQERWVVQDGVDTEYRITALSQYFNIAKLTGLVLGNEVSGQKVGTVGYKVLENYKSQFSKFDAYDSFTFNVGETDAMKYIGKVALAFVKVSKVNTVNDTIIYIKDDLQGGTLTLDASQLVGVTFNADNTVGTLEYKDENDKEKKIKFSADEYSWDEDVWVDEGPDGIPDNADDTWRVDTHYAGSVAANLYHNGLRSDETLDEIVDRNNTEGEELYATFTFYSTSAKNKYDFDTVFVQEYKTMIVDEVDDVDGIITGEDDETQYIIETIDYKDEDNKVTFVDDKGKDVKPIDIDAGDVLTVIITEGTDFTYYNVTVSTDTIEGEITKVDPSNTASIRQKVTIGGKVYYVAVPEIFTKGDKGTFKLDANGRLVSLDLTASTNAYAIFLGDGKNNEGIESGSEYTKFKIVDQNGKEKTLSTVAEVKINGDKKGNVGLEPGTLIRYTTSDSKVDTIFTWDQENSKEFKDQLGEYVYDDVMDVWTGLTAKFEHKSGKKLRAQLDGATKWNDIADDAIIFAGTDKNAKVLKAADIEDGRKTDPAFLLGFNKNKDGAYTVIWITGDAPTNATSERLFVYADIDDIKLSNGDDAFEISYWDKETKTGPAKVKTTDDDSMYEGLNKGDVFVPEFDAEGYVKNIRILSEVGGPVDAAVVAELEALNDKAEYIYGDFVNKDGGYVTIDFNGVDEEVELKDLRITYVKMSNKTIESKVSLTNAGEGSYVIVKMYDGEAQEAVIYY